MTDQYPVSADTNPETPWLVQLERVEAAMNNWASLTPEYALLQDAKEMILQTITAYRRGPTP